MRHARSSPGTPQAALAPPIPSKRPMMITSSSPPCQGSLPKRSSAASPAGVRPRLATTPPPRGLASEQVT
eukprot:4537597-Pyramimonas_sp.AAC.1